VHAVGPLPVAAPPGLFEHRKRLGRHPDTDLTEAIGPQGFRGGAAPAESAPDRHEVRLGCRGCCCVAVSAGPSM
jgi:hypothetical protein